MHSIAQLAVCLGLFASSAMGQYCFQAVEKIGADQSYNASLSAAETTKTVQHDKATYIAVHFSQLDLPAGASITVSSPNGESKATYTGKHTDFYAEYIQGDSAVVTYHAPKHGGAEPVISIDRYASGFPENKRLNNLESICGKDDSEASICYKDKEPTQYKKAQAVARLFMNGSGLCTGWLFGSEGHMITNNHCIGDAAAAKNVQVEMGAECTTCNDPNNTKQLGCKGKVVASSVEFIHTNKALDYTLVKINSKDLASYGYLTARASGPVLGEEIYIPQHPGGKPTRIAVKLDDGKPGTIEDMGHPACVDDEVGYMVDTEPGASGSPVLSAKDNTVIALHNCGGCLNGAIKIDKIVKELQSLNKLPKNALDGNDDKPTYKPTDEPTDMPTDEPTDMPTDEPTDMPTNEPTDMPTDKPTFMPTDEPTDKPTDKPTTKPTFKPKPTGKPTAKPTNRPRPSTPRPVTKKPSAKPTSRPSSGAKKIWEQCGGKDYTGSTSCADQLTCVRMDDWYSQCVPGLGFKWN
ncbi:hypothetical protein ACHHYP_02523 [Achlya hypogyna]|uniref:CBM1 domain-containing protein n=1 Tax=Achlya hypogyna TaxID=1202772 RepID=A0A1V9Z630_ACHHY|nr:hypothetical protein ACHHYP_02523 [Achlya hypogyna]